MRASQIFKFDFVDFALDVLVPAVEGDVLGLEAAHVFDDVDELLLAEAVPQLFVDEAQVFQLEHLFRLHVEQLERGLSPFLRERVALSERGSTMRLVSSFRKVSISMSLPMGLSAISSRARYTKAYFWSRPSVLAVMSTSRTSARLLRGSAYR